MAFRVLCAFQTPELFAFVKDALSPYDCELIKASSEALALYLTQKNYPCLVLCEFQSGHDDWGESLLAELKSLPEFRDIPFVSMFKRGSDIKQSAPKALQGIELCLTYPIETYEFRLAIEKFLIEIADNRVPESPE